MTLKTRNAAMLFVAVAVLMPAAAQAQWIHTGPSQPPLYPYVAQPDQPYAVQVSPNTYVIHRPGDERRHHHVRNRNVTTGSINVRSKADPALVEELRSRRTGKHAALETTHVVRDRPVVVETKRYVDDPPRVVERYVDPQGRPVRAPKTKRVATVTNDAPVIDKNTGKDGVKRVINAEAEITIIGPDRMNIRLYRKGSKANASAEQ